MLPDKSGQFLVQPAQVVEAYDAVGMGQLVHFLMVAALLEHEEHQAEDDEQAEDG